DDYELPDEKISLFEECGWEYVTGKGYIHVFRAPEGSEAPEFYMKPQQQAVTLKKLRRSYILAPFVILFWLAFYLLLCFSMSNDTLPDVFRSINMGFYRDLVEHTALTLFYVIVLSGAVLDLAYGCFRTMQLYRRLKRGKAIDHSPKKRRLVYKSVRWVFLILAAMSLVMTAAELISHKKYDMPQNSDGPYITLDTLGYEGVRGYIYNASRTSKTEHMCSLFAEYWNTYECLILDNSDVWLYQDVYELKAQALTHNFALALMDDGTFARSVEEYSETDVPGFESAYISRYEAVAIKGDYVVRIVYFPPDYYESSGDAVIEVLEAIARRIGS
ncbi:MAG: DUF2812 domain-containing protein, partial [Oscillospiraceae bacterium]